MGFVATAPLRWADGTIEPGEPVPDGEAGRDYAGLLHLGLIREAGADAGKSDERLARELAEARAEIDRLRAGGGEPASDDPAVPDPSDDGDQADDADGLPAGVTDLGGGWYQLADDETKVHGRKALDAALAEQQQ